MPKTCFLDGRDFQISVDGPLQSFILPSARCGAPAQTDIRSSRMIQNDLNSVPLTVLQFAAVLSTEYLRVSQQHLVSLEEYIKPAMKPGRIRSRNLVRRAQDFSNFERFHRIPVNF